VTPRFDVVGLGLNARDQIVEIGAFPGPGGKVRYSTASLAPGGQVAVACVVCQRHGLRTRYAGRIGDDAAGVLQREELAAEGIELSALRVVPDTLSQQATVFVDTRGERTIVFERSPDLAYPLDAVSPSWIASGEWLLVDGYDAAAAAGAARIARATGTRVLSDLSNLYPEQSTHTEDLLHHTDDLICSHRFPESFFSGGNLLQSLPRFRATFGIARVAVTLGREGVLALDASGWHYTPGYVVPETDTTGAGDVFHGGFLIAQQSGATWTASLDFAAALAALNCTARGARGHIATAEEANAFRKGASRHPAPAWLQSVILAAQS